MTLVGRPDLEGWCEIRVEITAPEGSWSASSRCLLATEVTRLADWLEAVETDSPGADEFWTADNEIHFEWIEGEPRQLRVYLEWAFRPMRYRESTEEFWIDYPVTEHNLRLAAASLREQLRRATQRS